MTARRVVEAALAIAVVGAVVLPGSQATASSPGIRLTPAQGPPGATLAVSGRGFAPSLTVSLYFDHATVGSTSADATGSFAVLVAAPVGASPGRHFVRAQDASGARARASFVVVTPSEWTQQGADATQTNFNPSERVLGPGNVSQATEQWTASGNPAGQPLVADGRVYLTYVGSSSQTISVYDLETGQWLWSVNGSTPVVAQGELFSTGRCGNYGQCYSVEAHDAASGAVLWTRDMADSLVIAATQSMVLAVASTTSGKDTLLALDPDTGATLWEREPIGGRGASYGNDILVSGERIYAVRHPVYLTGQARIQVIDANTGVTLRTLGPYVEPDLQLGSISGGILFAVGHSSAFTDFYALDPEDGSILWTRPTGGMSVLPAVANGVLYMSSGPGELSAFVAETGQELWLRTGLPSPALPVVAGGVLYVPSDNLLALDPATGDILWTGPGAFAASVAEGRLLIVCSTGCGAAVYAPPS